MKFTKVIKDFPAPIPHGCCQCGCGTKTKPARKTETRQENVRRRDLARRAAA